MVSFKVFSFLLTLTAFCSSALAEKTITRTRLNPITHFPTKTTLNLNAQASSRILHSSVQKLNGALPKARKAISVPNQQTAHAAHDEKIIAPKTSRPSTVQIFAFPSHTNPEVLNQKLQNIDSSLKVATASQFKKGSICSNASTVCVLVSEKNLPAFNAAKPTLGLPSSVGMIVENAQSVMKRVKNKPKGQPKSTGFYQSEGTTYTDYLNPDPSFYYIDDNQNYPNGWYQIAGAWLPWAVVSNLSPTAMITNVTYDINIYHPYPHDLVIDVGYDASSIGGVTSELDQVYNQPNGFISGYNTFSVSTDAFNGLHPDSYYYVKAYDVAALDVGYIDYVSFQVDWIDYPNLTFYGNNSYNYQFTDSTHRYLTANNALYNNSFIDITSPFAVGWYAELDTSVGQNCSNLSYDPSGPNTWLVGYNDLPYQDGNTYTSVGLSSVDLDQVGLNSNGFTMLSGNYCLWAYADDLEQIYEWDEVPNPAPGIYWDNIYDMGTFTYVHQDSLADLSWNYTAPNTLYTLNSGYLNASGTIVNLNSLQASAGFNAFEIAWFLSPVSNPNCNNVNLNVNNAYFVGADYLNVLNGWSSAAVSTPANVNINFAQTPGGNLFSNASGYFCLWAWVDDFDQVQETNESNNVIIYTNPIFHSPVGVEETNKNPEITLYPNPTSDLVRITLPFELASQKTMVQILDQKGSIVRTLQRGLQGSSLEIGVSDLPASTYIVQVQTGSVINTKKLTVIH